MTAETSIRFLECDGRMYVGEARHLYFEVVNGTRETWPSGLAEEPLVRLSYHLRTDKGGLLQFDGPRSPFPAPLAPGHRAVVPVLVGAPAEAGRYLLEVDIVHEHVRWFDRAAVVELEVVPRGPTQRNVPGWTRLLRPLRVPRVFHQIWFGPAQMPDEHRRFAETWRRLHPGWELRLWTDADLPALDISPELVAQAKTPAELSNVARYEIVARHGGVYVDTDFECLRPIDRLVRGIAGFAACSFPGNVAPGFVGAVPGHAAMVRAATLARRYAGWRHPEATTGPILFTHVLWDFPEFTVFPPELFYPYLWDEMDRGKDDFPDAYAVHHWTLSWKR
jgi:hypothetical protein